MKIRGVKYGQSPQKVKHVRAFIGLSSNYRKFARLLHALTKKGRRFDLTKECWAAFRTLKQISTEVPILALLRYAKSSEIRLLHEKLEIFGRLQLTYPQFETHYINGYCDLEETRKVQKSEQRRVVRQMVITFIYAGCTFRTQIPRAA